MALVRVTHRGGDAFWIETRGHVLAVDQPGVHHEGAGATPVELFVMSLASCVAYYAVRYLREQRLPSDGLAVQCRWSMRPEPSRVGRIDVTVDPPANLGAEDRAALAAAAEDCTVHQTLLQPPAVTIRVAEPSMAAAQEV